MNPAPWLPLAAGREITQPRTHLIAKPCRNTSGLFDAGKNSDFAPLLFRLELVAALRVVGDVEGVVGGRLAGVVASLDDERVGLSPHDVYLGDHEAVDVPRDAPTHVS